MKPLAVKIYRTVKTEGRTPSEALRECLAHYQSPIPADVMQFQIGLAAAASSDLEFVPPFSGRARERKPGSKTLLIGSEAAS